MFSFCWDCFRVALLSTLSFGSCSSNMYSTLISVNEVDRISQYDSVTLNGGISETVRLVIH